MFTREAEDDTKEIKYKISETHDETDGIDKMIKG
jgi:hypothetical protein